MKFLKRKKKSSKYAYGKSPVLYGNKKPRSRKAISSLRFLSSDKLKRVSILLAVITLLAGGTYFLFFSPNFLLSKTIIVQDGIKQENHPFEHYFGNIKGQNIFFLKTEEIEAKLKNDYPEIENIKIRKRIPNGIEVTYTEFPIVANLMQSIEGIQQKYLINSKGQTVKKDIENPNLPYIKINSSEAFALKTEVISLEKLKYILESRKYFEEKFGMKVFDVQYLKEAREVHLRTEKYFTIWLDMTQEYSKQFDKLKKVLNNLDIYNTPLEYIDLRIAGNSGDKIIFKKK